MGVEGGGEGKRHVPRPLVHLTPPYFLPVLLLDPDCRTFQSKQLKLIRVSANGLLELVHVIIQTMDAFDPTDEGEENAAAAITTTV